jgi:flagellar hook-basal body complex protein FliE
MKIEPSGQELPIQIGDLGDASPGKGEGVADVGFGDLLARGIADANKLQAEAGAKADAVARGTSDDLHGTMISSKEADIALKLVGSVRNRLLDAFHELWRINL